jgi:CRP-like cAMP-binding protein
MNETITLKANEILMHEGSASNEMYYLQSGSLVVLKKKGNELHTIGNIVAGELVGDMSFLDGFPRSATIKALTDSVLLVVPHERFEKALEANPKWFKALLSTLLNRLRKADAKIKI